MKTFKMGLKKGIPVAIGYFPVAFSFGVLCISSGMNVGLATLISLTNVTSSGQFAGVNLMLSHATYFEISLTLLMINARYFLMSLSLSQKIDEKMTTLQRMIISFVVTDETFALASLEEDELNFSFMLGLILLPFLGWASGTLAGELVMGLLPKSVQGAMGIALYAMFLALIVPASKKDKKVFFVVAMSVMIHSLLTFVPVLTTGMKLIITILLTSCVGAYLFPRRDEE